MTVVHVKAGTSGQHRSLRLNHAFHYGMFRFYRDHYAPQRNPLRQRRGLLRDRGQARERRGPQRDRRLALTLLLVRLSAAPIRSTVDGWVPKIALDQPGGSGSERFVRASCDLQVDQRLRDRR